MEISKTTNVSAKLFGMNEERARQIAATVESKFAKKLETMQKTLFEYAQNKGRYASK